MTVTDEGRPPILSAEEVGHSYRSQPAIVGVDLTIDGTTTALIGVNGAGKSTLLRILAGAQQPDRGRVRVCGRDLYRRGERARALPAVSLMPQSAGFPPGMTPEEVVSHIGWLRGLSMADAQQRASTVLDQVGLAARRSARMRELSGGMARRVALAQALVSRPRLLLLDEPSTGLDPEQRRIMIDLVKDLDCTVLFSSHIIEDVVDVAERVLVLEQGRIVADTTVDGLATTGSTTAGPGASIPVRAEAGFLTVVAEARSQAR